MQRSPRQLVRYTVGALVLIAAGIYLYTQLDTFIGGPTLSITEPADNSSVVTEEQLVVRGTAHNIDTLSLNGRGISVDQNTEFHEMLLVTPGFNIIEVTAEDRFGRTETQTRFVIYKPPPQTPQTQATTSVDQTIP